MKKKKQKANETAAGTPVKVQTKYSHNTIDNITAAIDKKTMQT